MPRIGGSSIDANIVDGASLFDAAEAFTKRAAVSRITIDYGALRHVLDALRKKQLWRLSKVNSIFVSADPDSEGQQRFQAMLSRSGFDPAVVHYRDSYVSLPPGMNPLDSNAKPISSFASHLTYAAGLMARFSDPHVIFVSHVFELYAPLTNLANRLPEAKIAIAYFGSLMDHRWKTVGIENPNHQLPFKFFDLDDFAEEIIGLDLKKRPHFGNHEKGGFDSL